MADLDLVHSTSRPPTTRHSRRAFLGVVLPLAGATVLAACGQPQPAAPAATSAPAKPAETKPAEAPKPTEAPKPAAPAADAKPTTAPAAAAPATTAGQGAPASGGSTPAPAIEGKLPSPAVGVPDGYTKTPAPFKTYDGKPGKGGKVSSFTIAYQPPPTPRDQSQYWQDLERRLGVTWEPIITPQPDYGNKSAALIAGGTLPDLFYLNPTQNAAPQYKAMDQGAFTDLTPFVTGDALKEYQNLSTFPDYMWNNVKFKNKIYGVPKPLQRNGNIGFYRGDWLKKLGKELPKSPDEVHDTLVAFAKNDPDGNGQADTWGLSRYGTDWAGWDDARVAANMFGTPYSWRKNADGTLTHEMETDEFRQEIEYLRRLYADGAFHPDAAGMTFAQCQSAYLGGKLGVHSEGIGNFYSPTAAGTVYFKIRQADPNAQLVGLLPTLPGGSKAVTRNTPGSFGFTGIPASVGKDKERVKELLRVLDYLASPFGSEEWRFLQYGIEGVDHTVKDTVPVLNERGIAERGDLVYLMANMPVLFYPADPDAVAPAQKLAHEIIQVGIDDPSWPLYSPTNVSKLAELRQYGFDQITSIVTGRAPMSALDDTIKEWKSRGGDQTRQEFEQSLKA
jgi:putative aldouronate transport system substrate-binding protein